jgi:hypothetical protein
MRHIMHLYRYGMGDPGTVLPRDACAVMLKTCWTLSCSLGHSPNITWGLACTIPLAAEVPSLTDAHH